MAKKIFKYALLFFLLEIISVFHYNANMGYVFDFSDALAYEQWLNKEENQRVVDLENRLMFEMLRPRFGQRILDIGCGAGASLMPFIGKGIQLTGVDPSPYMLDMAKKKIGHRVDFHRAYAEELPFDDNSFDYATFCLSLEFSEDPLKALSEACRVAKDGVFVGILNKIAFKAVHCRIRGIFKSTVYNRARFFSIGEIKYLFASLLGEVPVVWNTSSHFKLTGIKLTGIKLTGIKLPRNLWPDVFQRSKFAIKSPFGEFAGIMAQPVPRFRTTPLTLKSIPANSLLRNGRPVRCAEKKTEDR